MGSQARSRSPPCATWRVHGGCAHCERTGGRRCRGGSQRWRRCFVSPSIERRGFTLIELLVVIVVIAILAGLVGPMVFRNVGDAKVTAAKAQLELFGLALDQYRLDNDYYPSAAQGLDALRSTPQGEPSAHNWRGPPLKKTGPPDPSGRAYNHASTAA